MTPNHSPRASAQSGNVGDVLEPSRPADQNPGAITSHDVARTAGLS